MEKDRKNVILIVDDYPANIKVLGGILQEKYDLLVATNGEKAVSIAKEMKPDLILMDVVMPEMDGFSAAKVIKNDVDTADIPIIFITSKGETGDIVKGFEAGGQDYITKPPNPEELFARVNTHLELRQSKRAIENYVAELKSTNKELKELNARLEFMAWHDQLTGLPNRRQMRKGMKDEQSRTARSGRTFSLIMADIDDFKKINDNYGHEAGDKVLKHISKIVKSSLRQQDMVSRWGGEEFLIMLPETDINGALTAADKIRNRISDEPYQYGNESISMTITLGVSEFVRTEEIDETIKKADNALYKGKKRTKNCVVASE